MWLLKPKKRNRLNNDSTFFHRLCNVDAIERRPNKISVRTSVARRRDQARTNSGKSGGTSDRADVHGSAGRIERRRHQLRRRRPRTSGKQLLFKHGVSTVGSNRGIINSSVKSPKVSINLYPDWEIKAYTMQSRQGFWTCEEISLKPVKTRTLDQEHLETNQDPQACF